ncbi:MAG: hypothetical protein AAF441_08820 [Pseudomonadota bacterium]
MSQVSRQSALSGLRWLIVVPLFSATMAGCVLWPTPGGGGLAERHVTLSEPVRQTALRIERMDAAGARKSHPAAMRQAEDLVVRAHRALRADLYAEADEDLHRAERILDRIAGGPAG